MFRRLFGEGALSAAFIPEYTSSVRDGGAPEPGRPRESDQLASLTLCRLGLATGLLTLVVELVLLGLLLALPADPGRSLTMRLTMVMLPFMPLICIVAILAGMLQVHGKFAASASGPLLLNAFIIAVGAYFLVTGAHAEETAAYVIGVATVLSGLTKAFWFAKLLRPHVQWTTAFADARPRAARMFRKFVPVALGLGTLQLSALLDTAIAMWPVLVGPTMFGAPVPMDEGSNAILVAAQRLYQFPLGVFGIAVATAAFPLLARHAHDNGAFSGTLRRGLRVSLFIALPAAVGLVLVRHDLCAVLYGGHAQAPADSATGVDMPGGFTPEAIARCAAVLAGYAVGIWAYSLNHVLTRAFYARGDTATPMRMSIVMACVNLALNLVLIWPLREAGLAWSTAACAAAQCVILGVLCVRRLGVNPVDKRAAAGAARVALACGIMVIGVIVVLWLLRGDGATTWGGHAVRLGVACATGGVIYLGAAAALRLPELAWVVRREREDTLTHPRNGVGAAEISP